MRKFLTLAALLFSIAMGAQSTMPHQLGELIIQIKNPILIDQLVDELSQVNGNPTGLTIIKELSAPMQLWHLKFDADLIDEAYMFRKMKQHPQVSIAQYNHFVEKRETIPNDPSFGQQWHHMNNGDNDIDSELAWDITTGGTTVFGDEIVVCVIEGGNLNHPDLVNNKWVNEGEIPDNNIDDDNNGYIDDYEGWNVDDQNDDFGANNGHGTNVCGMIGAEGNNENTVTGINWDVKIMGVAGYDIFDEANIVECYTYPLIQRQRYNNSGGEEGAFVVATNASWGIDSGDMNDVPIWNAFYDTLGVYGILNCGATSNSQLNVDVVGDIPTASPSDYMISVTATDENDVRTFSGFGQTTIDLGAPGEDVVTTSGATGITSTSGTSFASPLVAGSIALLYSTPCPSFGALLQTDPQGAADYIRQVLFDGVDPVANLETECVTGGRLNVNNSINLIMDNCSFDECLPPFGLTTSSDVPGVYDLQWNAFGEVSEFQVEYRIQGDPEWTVMTTDVPFFTFEDAQYCSIYEFRIAATCINGISGYSEVLTLETEGCCELPDSSDIIVSEVTSNSAMIDWPFILAATEVNLSVTPEGGDEIIYSDVQGNNLELTGLMACTTYTVSMSIECSDESLPFGSTVSFATSGCGACTDFDYCNSAGEGDEEWIESVKVNSADPSVTGSDGGYGDFTGTLDPWLINQGVNTFEAVPGYEGGDTFNERFRVWIDYDQNGEFDGEEEIIDEIVEAPFSIDFTLPEDALEGNTRMRVAMKWSANNQAPPIPCLESFDFGEVEDYCVVIDHADNIS
ncbi:MAG: S8 family serine peptidase, partial [Flavobacteriales bacterium]